MEGSSPEDLSVGPSVINRSRTIHMEGSSPESGGFLSVGLSIRSSPEDLSVGPSVINRSRTFRN